MSENQMGVLRILSTFILLLRADAFRVRVFENVAYQGRVQGNDCLRSSTNGHGRTSQGCFLQPGSNAKYQRRRTSFQMQQWDGDDLRWKTRFLRKLSRRNMILDASGSKSRAKSILICFQILSYGCQILTTITYIRNKFPTYWSTNAAEMIGDSIWGSGVTGPLTKKFGFSASFSQPLQSYRYITSGFLHDGLLQLVAHVTMIILQPDWLASDLGGPLYLTTFIGSIVTGNFMHVANTSNRFVDDNLYVGANGGICGIFGLMAVCLVRISGVNPKSNGPGGGQLARGIGFMLLLSIWYADVSFAMNVGGFMGGVLIGFLCGPSYGKSYSMRRKNSIGYDPVSQKYRSVMGFGIMPTNGGMIPLKVIYSILLVFAIAIPRCRIIPFAILRELMSLSP